MIFADFWGTGRFPDTVSGNGMLYFIEKSAREIIIFCFVVSCF